jgi:hypothetical protein
MRAVRETVTVTAMRARDEVVFAQRGNRTDRDGFLPCIEMHGTLDEIAREQIENRILKDANLIHLAQIFEQLLFARR